MSVAMSSSTHLPPGLPKPTLQDLIWLVMCKCFAIAPSQTLQLGYFQAIPTRLPCNRTTLLFNVGAAVLVRHDGS